MKTWHYKVQQFVIVIHSFIYVFSLCCFFMLSLYELVVNSFKLQCTMLFRGLVSRNVLVLRQVFITYIRTHFMDKMYGLLIVLYT